MTGEPGRSPFDPPNRDQLQINAMLSGLKRVVVGGRDFTSQLTTLESQMASMSLINTLGKYKQETIFGSEEFHRWHSIIRSQTAKRLKEKPDTEEQDRLLDIISQLVFEDLMGTPVLATDVSIQDNKPSQKQELEIGPEQRGGYPYDWEDDEFQPDMKPEKIDEVKLHPLYRRAMTHMVSGQEIDKQIEGVKGVFETLPHIRLLMLELFNMEIYRIAARQAAWTHDPIKGMVSAIEFIQTHATGDQAKSRMRSSLDKKLFGRAREMRAGISTRATGPYGDSVQNSEMLLRVFASTEARAEAMIDYLRDNPV